MRPVLVFGLGFWVKNQTEIEETEPTFFLKPNDF